jgi:hypothetical protein
MTIEVAESCSGSMHDVNTYEIIHKEGCTWPSINNFHILCIPFMLLETSAADTTSQLGGFSLLFCDSEDNEDHKGSWTFYNDTARDEFSVKYWCTNRNGNSTIKQEFGLKIKQIYYAILLFENTGSNAIAIETILSDTGAIDGQFDSVTLTGLTPNYTYTEWRLRIHCRSNVYGSQRVFSPSWIENTGVTSTGRIGHHISSLYTHTDVVHVSFNQTSSKVIQYVWHKEDKHRTEVYDYINGIDTDLSLVSSDVDSVATDVLTIDGNVDNIETSAIYLEEKALLHQEPFIDRTVIDYEDLVDLKYENKNLDTPDDELAMMGMRGPYIKDIDLPPAGPGDNQIWIYQDAILVEDLFTIPNNPTCGG